jgi:hypothetical protein
VRLSTDVKKNLALLFTRAHEITRGVAGRRMQYYRG